VNVWAKSAQQRLDGRLREDGHEIYGAQTGDNLCALALGDEGAA
jgi:hypothetical protein